MDECFVGEQIRPVAETLDPVRMERGEPGLPGRFTWRGKEHAVEAVLEQWKETSRCTSGSLEQYVRKHWFRIRTTQGAEMKIYFERQARSGRERKSRWWLYTVRPAAEALDGRTDVLFSARHTAFPSCPKTKGPANFLSGEP